MNPTGTDGQQGSPPAIDESVMATAWSRSGGRCECHTISHGHDIRCNRQLVWPNRGRRLARGGWDLRLHGNGGQHHYECVCADCAVREGAAPAAPGQADAGQEQPLIHP